MKHLHQMASSDEFTVIFLVKISDNAASSAFLLDTDTFVLQICSLEKQIEIIPEEIAFKSNIWLKIWSKSWKSALGNSVGISSSEVI